MLSRAQEARVRDVLGDHPPGTIQTYCLDHLAAAAKIPPGHLADLAVFVRACGSTGPDRCSTGAPVTPTRMRRTGFSSGAHRLRCGRGRAPSGFCHPRHAVPVSVLSAGGDYLRRCRLHVAAPNAARLEPRRNRVEGSGTTCSPRIISSQLSMSLNTRPCETWAIMSSENSSKCPMAGWSRIIGPVLGVIKPVAGIVSGAKKVKSMGCGKPLAASPA